MDLAAEPLQPGIPGLNIIAPFERGQAANQAADMNGKPDMFRLSLLAGTAAALLPQASFAQPANSPASPADQPGAAQPAPAPAPPQNYHAPEQREIVVTGFRRNRTDVLSGTSVVTGDELTRDLRPTIGESLARQPGVSATSFGPNASRPILRGFQGERIRVMTDGIGSLDVSNTSVDHAVAINPLTADRIEVLRGPSALLFGSVGDRRRRQRHRRAHPAPRAGRAGPCRRARDLRLGRRTSAPAMPLIDVPLGGKFVVHVDGNYSKTDDLRTGGYLLSPALRAAGGGEPRSRHPGARRPARPDAEQRRARPGTSPPAPPGSHGDNNVGFSISRL